MINPVFNEYISFLESKGVNYKLEEGFYWLDRQIVRAYDRDGNIHKILRVYTDDNLNITFKYYENKEFKIESWEDTLERKKGSLIKLEQESLNLIKQTIDSFEEYKPIIFTSGGKDSNLTVHLVRQIIDAKGYFNNTTLDCADTYRYIKKAENVEIINPKEGFYQWRKRLEFIPTRFARACCTLFKEGATIKHLEQKKKYLIFMGIRNQESSGRSDYQDMYKNPKWNTDNWQGVLPIRKWSEEEVWLYILWKNIDINEKYKKGYARVGCAIACPYYGKSTWILDKYWYSGMFDRWQNIIREDFIKNDKWTRMNCTLKEYMTNWNGGLVRKEPNEEVVTEFAKHKNIDISVAKKYFNNNCETCNKKVNKADDVAMNMKFNGRNAKELYCKKHLIERLDIDKLKWDEYIEDFKNQGCELF